LAYHIDVVLQVFLSFFMLPEIFWYRIAVTICETPAVGNTIKKGT